MAAAEGMGAGRAGKVVRDCLLEKGQEGVSRAEREGGRSWPCCYLSAHNYLVIVEIYSLLSVGFLRPLFCGSVPCVSLAGTLGTWRLMGEKEQIFELCKHESVRGQRWSDANEGNFFFSLT